MITIKPGSEPEFWKELKRNYQIIGFAAVKNTARMLRAGFVVRTAFATI